MRVRKIGLALLAVLMLANGLPLDVHAIDIAPLYEELLEARSELSISGQTASPYCRIKGKPGTTKVEANMTLQRLESNGQYTDVKTWPGSSDGTTLTMSKTWAVLPGYSYRVYVSAWVTRASTTEWFSCYSNVEYCG